MELQPKGDITGLVRQVNRVLVALGNMATIQKKSISGRSFIGLRPDKFIVQIGE